MSKAFTPKYTSEQREAITDAIVDRKLTPAEAVAAAAAGKLAPGLEPFDMPKATAGNLAWRERQRLRGDDVERKAKGAPADRIAALVDRGVAIAEHQTNRLERKARRAAGLTAADVELGRKLAGWLRELSALDRGVAPSKQTGRGARQTDDGRTETERQVDDGSTRTAELERAARADVDPAETDPHSASADTGLRPEHASTPAADIDQATTDQAGDGPADARALEAGAARPRPWSADRAL